MDDSKHTVPIDPDDTAEMPVVETGAADNTQAAADEAGKRFPARTVAIVAACIIAIAIACALALSVTNADGGTQPSISQASQTTAADKDEKATADTSKLSSLIDKANKLVDRASDEDTAKKLAEAVQAAVNVMDDAARGKADQAAVDAAAKDLANAIRIFQKVTIAKGSKGESIDKTETTGSAGTTSNDDVAASESAATTESYSGGGSTDNGASSSGNGNNNSSSAQSASPSSSSARSSESTSATKKERVWVDEQGHYETVIVQEAWDEPVYEEVVHFTCTACGTDVTGNESGHLRQHGRNDESASIAGYSENVQTGSIHHDAVTKQRWVVDVSGHWE